MSRGVGLEARAVSRTFAGGVKAIERIDLRVEPGEFVALLGPSGCGKSTFLRLVAGLDHDGQGELQVDRSGVAFVFQDANLLPWRSVLDNVALPLELRGEPKRDRDAKAREALERVGLSDALERRPAELSGGMRMRVSLARAVVTSPRLLLLDEPFAALDEITRQRLDDQLRALFLDRQMTVLFVTHSTTEAAYLADRAVVLSPRPATVVLDHPIELPRERVAELRTEAAFVAQVRVLSDALDRSVK